jgi:glutamate dehydrogenase (NAD(P)+)
MCVLKNVFIWRAEKVLEISRQKNIWPREAEIELASEGIKKAMSFRRWSLFSSAPDYI